MIHGYYEFCREYKRKPDSWADYIYGMSRLVRMHAMENIRMAEAVGVGTTGNKTWDNWHAEQRKNAGL